MSQARDRLEQGEAILRHTADGPAVLYDERTQAAVLRWLEIMGEAASNVPLALRAKHPEVPWSKMIGMRNVLIHAYPRVDLDLVWEAVERIPDLLEQLRAIVKQRE